MGDVTNVIPAERGTVVWAFKRMKEDALPALMDDLLEVQDSGIRVDQCKSIEIALGKMVNAATSIPDGNLFRAAIWQVMQNFEKTYSSWNIPKGATPEAASHRRQELEALRKLRHKIAKKTRKHGHVLAENLDLRLMEEIYEALGDVVSSGPDIFKELSKAVARFAQRK
jgi:hypothetical protein